MIKKNPTSPTIRCAIIGGKYRNRHGKCTPPDKDGNVMFYPKEANPHRVKLPRGYVVFFDNPHK